MTPYELGLYIQDFNEQVKRDQEEKITLAYLGAYWQRVKKMPDLKKLLGQEKRSTEQTPNQMLAEVKKLNAKMGGTTY